MSDVWSCFYVLVESCRVLDHRRRYLFSSMVNHSTLIKGKKTRQNNLLISYYFLKLKLSRFGLCYKSSALARCPIGGNKIVSRGHGG